MPTERQALMRGFLKRSHSRTGSRAVGHKRCKVSVSIPQERTNMAEVWQQCTEVGVDKDFGPIAIGYKRNVPGGCDSIRASKRPATDAVVEDLQKLRLSPPKSRRRFTTRTEGEKSYSPTKSSGRGTTENKRIEVSVDVSRSSYEEMKELARRSHRENLRTAAPTPWESNYNPWAIVVYEDPAEVLWGKKNRNKPNKEQQCDTMECS